MGIGNSSSNFSDESNHLSGNEKSSAWKDSFRVSPLRDEDPIPVPPDSAHGFTWSIENFSFCLPEGVSSPKFIFKSFGETGFSLDLDPIRDQQRDFFACRLKRGRYDKAITLGFRIAVLRSDDIPFEQLTYSGILEFCRKTPNHVIGLLPCQELFEAASTRSDTLIVRCHLWWPRQLVFSGLSTVTNILAVTLVSHGDFVFENEKSGSLGRSPRNGEEKAKHGDFELVDTESDRCVFLKIYPPVVKNDDPEEWIQIFFQNLGTSGSSCIKICASVLDVEGKVWRSSINLIECFWNGNSKNRMLPNFIQKSEIDLAKEQLVRPNGCVRFRYEVLFSFGGIRDSIEKRLYDSADRAPGNTLSQDLLNVYGDKYYADYKMNFTGRIFYAHCCIVCYRSRHLKFLYENRKVFKKREDCEEGESKPNEEPCLQRIKQVQFERLLQFLYTGEFDGEDIGQLELSALMECAQILQVVLPPLTPKENA